MPTIEERALATAIEAAGRRMPGYRVMAEGNALRRSIEAHARALEAHDATLAEFEAFRRKVSDKAEVVKKLHPTAACYLGDLILPKPVDPLVEAIRVAVVTGADDGDASRLRAALAKRGLKLVEVGDAD